jgi:osmotically-inducible protein OsmY
MTAANQYSHMNTKSTWPEPSIFTTGAAAALRTWRDVGKSEACKPADAIHKSDLQIRNALMARLKHQPWWDPKTSNVFVKDGVVIYQGLVPRRSDRHAARLLAQNVPDVRSVWDARVHSRDW